MPLTFENLIQHNKRTSVVLVLTVVGLITFSCAVFFLGNFRQREIRSPIQSLHSLELPFGLTGATGTAALSYFKGNWILQALSDANEVYHLDDPTLFNVTEEISIAAGLPHARASI